MKSLKNMLTGKPAKKEKVALKPPNAISVAQNKKLQLNEVIVVPSSSQQLLAIAACVALAVVLWFSADMVGVARVSSLEQSSLRRLVQLGQEDGFRPQLKRSASDDLATLHGVLSLSSSSSSSSSDAAWLEAVRSQANSALSRETLWDQSWGCAILSHLPDASRAHCQRCITSLQKFVRPHTDNASSVFSDASHSPTLRSTLLAASALRACEASPLPNVSPWVLSLQQPDGGFSPQQGLPSSAMATWRAALLIKTLGETFPEEQSSLALRFLQSCSASDGGHSDRPQQFLERSQRLTTSPLIPSLRAAHATLILSGHATSAHVRFALNSGHPQTASSLYHTVLFLRDLASHVSSLPASVANPPVASTLRGAALALAFLVAPHFWTGSSPLGVNAGIAASLVSASVLYEFGLPVLSVPLVAVALLIIVYLIVTRIPFNDTGEEMLYIAIASAAATAGLFFALGFSSPDIFASLPSIYVFGLWAPLVSYACCHVATMFLSSRPNSYYIAATYAGWLLSIGVLAFLLYRKSMLDTVIRLALLKGHFTPLFAVIPAIGLFANYVVALVSNASA